MLWELLQQEPFVASQARSKGRSSLQMLLLCSIVKTYNLA